LERVFGFPEAVAEGEALAGDGGDALAGDDDAYEVERVGGGDYDALGVGMGRELALGAQRFDCDGQRELLALKAIDKRPPRTSPRSSRRR